jgi:hypothetical protein
VPSELRLLVGRRGRDHAAAAHGDDLREQESDAARRGVNENVLAGLYLVGRRAQVLRGDAL